MKPLFNNRLSRRKFIAASAAAIIPSAFSLATSRHLAANKKLTIGEVIDTIKGAIPANISGNTVDTVKSGDISKPVTGIVTTMFATIDVIKRTIDAGANLIIAHEPTFYNHNDDTGWLADHDVFNFKRNLLEQNNIVVWRFHDYWHSVRPDGVLHGVLEKLEWGTYYDANAPFLLTLPARSLGDIVNYVKLKLGIQTLRFIGDRQQSCSKILLIPGAAGGRVHINALQMHKPDVLICGEVQEWETSEYIRDSMLKGEKRSLIVLGHIMSEEPGMECLVEWLQPRFPDLKITHIESGNPFTYA